MLFRRWVTMVVVARTGVNTVSDVDVGPPGAEVDLCTRRTGGECPI